MKLKRFGRGSSYSIADAVANTCWDDRDGVSETALATARATSEKLGELIELLHNKNLLTNKEVLSLLSCFEEEEEVD
jgi:hypothetical protein